VGDGLSGPYIQRDYSQLYSGQIYEMDDYTPEHICWGIQPYLAKNKLRPTYILDPRTVEAGEEMAANVAAHEKKQCRNSTTLRRIHALQRELNMSLPIENDPKRLAAVAEAGDLIKQSRLKRAEQLGRAS